MAVAEAGLRERKKAATRERIGSVAMELFLARGFDAVTVAEVAAAGDVAPQTVFNYFPAKEDLVMWRLEEFEDALLAGIEQREPGEGVAAAFRRELLERSGLLGDPAVTSEERLIAVNKMIDDTPSLQRREDRVFTSRISLLADLLRAEGHHGIVAPVVANALIGVHRALVSTVRERLLAGDPPARIAAMARTETERGLDLLSAGIASMRAGER